MKPNGDFVLKALLQHNYLPMVKRYREEVPPALTSALFTPDVARAIAGVPDRPSNTAKGYDEVDYRLTKHNGVSRLCTIPHPAPYARLALCIHEHWQELAFVSENPRSLIKPTAHDDGRLIVMDYGTWADKALRELGPAFGKRYMVRTDITNCFPSIYSHAIPWALAGLDEAKRNSRKKKEYYNQLDTRIQALKRGETKGIAIGPATSNIAAEIILAKVDADGLLSQNADFCRWIDDYHAFFQTEDEARRFVGTLEKCLGAFELQLNAQKTEIVRLPTSTAEDWVVSLARALPRGDDVYLRRSQLSELRH
jgi:hypothetical protein